jgi:hypothetical protein
MHIPLEPYIDFTLASFACLASRVATIRDLFQYLSAPNERRACTITVANIGRYIRSREPLLFAAELHFALQLAVFYRRFFIEAANCIQNNYSA